MSKKSISNIKTFIINHKSMMFTIIVVMALTIYLLSFVSPKIHIVAKIGDVRDKDYNIFINNNDDIATQSKTRENCRFISYSLKIKRPFMIIRDIKIERETLKQYTNEYTYYNQLDDGVKSLGIYFASDNMMNFSEGLNVFIEDLTEDKVKELMKDYIITVTWKDLINREHRQFYRIIDYLE